MSSKRSPFSSKTPMMKNYAVAAISPYSNPLLTAHWDEERGIKPFTTIGDIEPEDSPQIPLQSMIGA